MNKMNKQKTYAFGKDVYLLGKNKNGEYIWLEAAKWDCDWYWGFGYIETYTNNRFPDKSRDIQSHSHWTGLVGNMDIDTGIGTMSEYIHHLNKNPNMSSTVLNDSESWELADLMQSFYTLKASAELFHIGNSHLTSNIAIDFKNKDMENYINQVLMPQIFKRVYEILMPEP